MKKISRLFKRLSKSGKKGVAWLIDPEKQFRPEDFHWIKDSGLDLILVGGSSGGKKALETTIKVLKTLSGSIPICIFPGSKFQLSDQADGILFLSLISGNNPEYLIGHQAEAALELEKMSLEILPTGYILVNDAEIRSVHQVSDTLPILNSDLDRLRAVALAGKFLGLKYFYLEAGSGATNPVSFHAIEIAKKTVSNPVIVGGGLNSLDKVEKAFSAGADLVVLGNKVEETPRFLEEVLKLKSCFNQVLNIN